MSCGMNIARTSYCQNISLDSIWIDLEATAWTSAWAESTQRTFGGSAIRLLFLINSRHFQTRNRPRVLFVKYPLQMNTISLFMVWNCCALMINCKLTVDPQKVRWVNSAQAPVHAVALRSIQMEWSEMFWQYDVLSIFIPQLIHRSFCYLIR